MLDAYFHRHGVVEEEVYADPDLTVSADILRECGPREVAAAFGRFVVAFRNDRADERSGKIPTTSVREDHPEQGRVVPVGEAGRVRQWHDVVRAGGQRAPQVEDEAGAVVLELEAVATDLARAPGIRALMVALR